MADTTKGHNAVKFGLSGGRGIFEPSLVAKEGRLQTTGRAAVLLIIAEWRAIIFGGFLAFFSPSGQR
jgi:hypothetical protein